ncbi:MAG: Maf family nucleotide pyrophosphatase [Bacteroidales bacterium]|nr:Maf family nucleotide pyrophosphatase [Bacteroidales bacterium]
MDPFLEKKLHKHRIILASGSPRRHNLLRALGLDFTIKPAEIDETYPKDLKREKIPVYLAKLKSTAFPSEMIDEDEIVITADTIVWLNNDVLTKPADREDAFRILNALSDSRHEVYSGVCLKSRNKLKTFHACSEVFFRKLQQEEIEYYVDTFKPFDKAGAYGIQEWIGYIGIEKISGSFYNVMGLPTQKLYEELLKF